MKSDSAIQSFSALGLASSGAAVYYRCAGFPTPLTLQAVLPGLKKSQPQDNGHEKPFTIIPVL
jgi:hypothetical protein